MNIKQKTLLIWDFDGVVADSEKLWVKTWYEALLQKKGIKLSDEQVKTYLTGLSEKTKQKYINDLFNKTIVDDAFINYTRSIEILQIQNVLEPTPGVEQIFADSSWVHCIATGTSKPLALMKLKKVGLWEKYINEKNCFTSDMVQNGKPAPDLFLFAAQKMGYTAEKCVVIEDSINGIKAAKAANMKVIAFIGAENNNNDDYAKACTNEGVFAVVRDMNELHILLSQHFS